LTRVYKGETDTDYIDGNWRVRNLMKAREPMKYLLQGADKSEFRYGT